jgi:hypothetical protein
LENDHSCGGIRNRTRRRVRPLPGLRPATIGIHDLETNFRNTVPDAVTVTQHFMKHGNRAEAMGKRSGPSSSV